MSDTDDQRPPLRQRIAQWLLYGSSPAAVRREAGLAPARYRRHWQGLVSDWREKLYDRPTLIAQELARLDDLARHAWVVFRQRGGGLAALKVLLAISDRRIRLLGLAGALDDNAQQTEFHVVWADAREDAPTGEPPAHNDG